MGWNRIDRSFISVTFLNLPILLVSDPHSSRRRSRGGCRGNQIRCEVCQSHVPGSNKRCFHSSRRYGNGTWEVDQAHQRGSQFVGRLKKYLSPRWSHSVCAKPIIDGFIMMVASSSGKAIPFCDKKNWTVGKYHDHRNDGYRVYTINPDKIKITSEPIYLKKL